jgi:hypothetical protein
MIGILVLMHISLHILEANDHLLGLGVVGDSLGTIDVLIVIQKDDRTTGTDWAVCASLHPRVSEVEEKNFRETYAATRKSARDTIQLRTISTNLFSRSRRSGIVSGWLSYWSSGIVSKGDLLGGFGRSRHMGLRSGRGRHKSYWSSMLCWWLRVTRGFESGQPKSMTMIPMRAYLGWS